jgi:hypothetical protein
MKRKAFVFRFLCWSLLLVNFSGLAMAAAPPAVQAPSGGGGGGWQCSVYNPQWAEYLCSGDPDAAFIQNKGSITYTCFNPSNGQVLVTTNSNTVASVTGINPTNPGPTIEIGQPTCTATPEPIGTADPIGPLGFGLGCVCNAVMLILMNPTPLGGGDTVPYQGGNSPPPKPPTPMCWVGTPFFPDLVGNNSGWVPCPENDPNPPGPNDPVPF